LGARKLAFGAAGEVELPASVAAVGEKADRQPLRRHSRVIRRNEARFFRANPLSGPHPHGLSRKSATLASVKRGFALRRYSR
jgi:hypothetical protein